MYLYSVYVGRWTEINDSMKEKQKEINRSGLGAKIYALDDCFSLLTGTFNNCQEAQIFTMTLVNKGFTDSFILRNNI